MSPFPVPADASATVTDETAGSLILGDRRDIQASTSPMITDVSTHNELIVSGIHLELTPSLKTYVEEKTDRLFRHEERIRRLRVELECDPKEAVATRFKAKGHIMINGPDMNATIEADECHKAVDFLVDKLDRMLRRRSRWHKVKRKHTHPVELGVALPKAV